MSRTEHGILTDASIGRFLAARRKLIAGLLGVAAMLASGTQLGMSETALVIQAAFGFLALYGIHEVENTGDGQ